MQSKAITVKSFAERWGVCDRTVQRWIDQGKLNALRVGRVTRIPLDEVERFEEKNCVSAGGE